MSALLPRAVATLAVVFGGLAGCGGDVFVDQGSGGSSASSESSGANSTGSSKPSSGSGHAPPALACSLSVSGVSVCYSYSNIPGGLTSSLDAACTSAKGTVVDACPTNGIIGCCTQSEAGIEVVICYYQGAVTRSEVKMECKNSGGSFSDSAP